MLLNGSTSKKSSKGGATFAGRKRLRVGERGEAPVLLFGPRKLCALSALVQCVCHRLAGTAKNNGIETDREHSNSGFDCLSTAIWIGSKDGASNNSDNVLGTCCKHLLISF